MGRPLRIDSPDSWHHVMNRGAGRRVVFRDDGERALFVALVSELDRRFGVEVHAYCLMGNHYHLLVRSRDKRLSSAMQWLGAHFTRAANARRGVDGAIFRGRFHSVRVERDAHLVWLFRYINANPIDLGWVGRLADYPWSGLAASLGVSNETPWVATDFVHDYFGDDLSVLDSFVEEARDPERSVQPITLRCTPDAIAQAAEIARAPGPHVDSDGDVRAARTVVAVDRLGLSLEDQPTVDGLGQGAMWSYLRRARCRATNRSSVRKLVERTLDVLAIDADRRTQNHSVSDTEWCR